MLLQYYYTDTQLQQPTVVSSMAGVQLNFTWTVVNLDCNSVDSYQITASGCGDCPVATETTSALCSALQMPAVCRFSVQSMVCGEVGMPSNEVTVSVRGISIFIGAKFHGIFCMTMHYRKFMVL